MAARRSASIEFTSRLPWTFVVGPWLLVFVFWEMNLTYFSDASPLVVAGLISTFVVPYLLVDFLLYLHFWRSEKGPRLRLGRSTAFVEDVGYFESQILWMFAGFIAIFAFETAVFGFIPLISMIRGGDVSQFDFGIPGLHGFLFSLGATTATGSYVAYKLTNKRKFQLICAAILVSFALLVTRKMIIVVFLQLTVLEFLISGWKRLLLGVVAALVAVYTFGLIGDIRTGRDLILSLANLRGNYPDWLPSGLIWIYIYVLTPMANYINFVHFITPDYSIADLFSWIIPPRVIASFTGAELDDAFANDWQIDGAFNIPSGLAFQYQVFGHAGVMLSGAVIAFVTFFIKHRGSLKSLMTLSVIYACLALMVFNNNFVALNVCFQFPLIYLMFRSRNRGFRPTAATTAGAAA